ncbi:MAG: ABC transporter substrate-binding protein [Nitrospira sp.]|nr:ABC transporter substrate-binding protein [Candidatus Manganitrophaceae bacterium]HIL33847.1 ABC transporter substrate-binding protein [Candidatus Manganitrophaceae bacterium]
MLKAIIISIGLLLFTSPVIADDLEEVKTFLSEKLSATTRLLQNKDLPIEEKKDKILGIVREAFDFPLMAKLTLGRKYWPRLSKEERKRFTSLFVHRLQASYVDKLDLYKDEEVTINKSVHVKKKIHVLTSIISGTKEINMLYKFYKSKKRGWLVYDIEIQGVSLITTYRSQFNEVLRTGTIDDLFLKLEKSDIE